MNFDGTSGGLDMRLQELTGTQLASPSPQTELDVSKDSDDLSSTSSNYAGKSLHTDSDRKAVVTKK